MDRNDIISNELLFQEALTKAGNSAYLGDRKVVASVLSKCLGILIDHSDDEKETKQKVFEATGKTFAAIFLGEDSNFTTVNNWNKPGGIDVFCAKWIGSTETDPHQIMFHVLIKFYLEIGEVAKAVGHRRTKDGEWEWQVDATFIEFINILLGLDPVTVDLIDIVPEETET